MDSTQVRTMLDRGVPVHGAGKVTSGVGAEIGACFGRRKVEGSQRLLVVSEEGLHHYVLSRG